MHRTLGMAFMVVGVIGLVCNLILIPAIWVGHNMLDQQVGVLAAQVRTPLQQTVDAAGQASDRVQSLHTTLGQLPPSQLLARLDDTVVPAYQRLRDGYVTLKDRLQTAAQTIATLRAIAPWLPLPTLSLPLDDLRTIDAQLTDFDSTLQQIRAGLTNTAQLLDNAVNTIAGAIDDVAARAQQAIGQVDATEATLKNLLTAIAAALTLLCLYGAALHAALFAYGRSLRRTRVPVTAPQGLPAVSPPSRVADESLPGSTSRA